MSPTGNLSLKKWINRSPKLPNSTGSSTKPGSSEGIYHPVNRKKTMENHNSQWVNPLFQWLFSIAMFVYQRVIFQGSGCYFVTSEITTCRIFMKQNQTWLVLALHSLVYSSDSPIFQLQVTNVYLATYLNPYNVP